MNQIYKKNEFIVVPFYKSRRSCQFMVINTSKKKTEGFENAHTHLRSFKMSTYLISLAINKRINNNLSPYLLRSLIRISTDSEYIRKLEELIAVKKQKGKKKSYYNKRGK